MTRSAWGPWVAVTLSLCLSGSGTTFAQTSEEPSIGGVRVELPPPGIIDWDQAIERQAEMEAALPAAGELPEVTPVEVPPPQPGPEMPMPPGFETPALPEAVAPAAPVGPEPPPAPLAPPLGGSFEAIIDNFQRVPPDTHGAVGPTEIMTTLNSQVRRHLKNLPIPTIVSTLPLDTFWSGVADPIADVPWVFDPRVHFDPDPAYGGRWIWVACQAIGRAESSLLVGVSADATPVRGWGWNIDADPANTATDGVWFDYPNVGFNKKWVVVQVNVFSYDTTMPGVFSFVESRIYVFDKDALYNGTASTTLITPDPGLYGATQVPAVTFDFAANDLYLLQRFNSGAGALQLYRISGAVGSEVLTPLAQPLGPPWSTAPTGGLDFAPQGPGCGTNKIQANDARIQAVFQRYGTLWATHTVFYPAGGFPTRASVQWWQINTAGTVLQRGLIDDPTGSRFYAFPSLAVNKHEDVLIGYSSFEGTQWASGSYSFRGPTDPLGTLQADTLLKAGEACYYKAPAGRNRWGDYSATVVDPTDDTRLWTIQEYAATPSGSDRWGTWWGMLDPTRTIAIADASVAEGNSGTTLLTFTLTLSEATTQTVTVNWATNDGGPATATVADGDFVGASGVVTFSPGQTVRTVDVTVNGDIKWEPDETFFVDLSGPTNAVLADAQAVGTILNDEPLPQISIGDVTKLEGGGGEGNTSFVFTITLSHPSQATVQVSWATVPGTALAGPLAGGNDFFAGSGTVTFLPGVLSQTITVQVHGDGVAEPDEFFYVDLSVPVNGTLLRQRGVGTILDEDAVNPGVVAFSIVADGDAASGRNRLQWLTPAGAAGATQFLIKFNQSLSAGGSCTPPDPFDPGVASDGAMPPPPVPSVTAGATQSLSHGGLNLDWEYCYTIWIEYPGPTYSLPGATMSARPFDATGKVKWKYFTGNTSLAAPTVGLDAVVVPSNDKFFHAMQRSGTGGPWLAMPWRPRALGALSHHRVPVVPLPGGSRAFIATDDGRIHAIDTANGNLVWSTLLQEGDARGAPSGIFTAFGGAFNYILVGSSSVAGNNHFYALDPFTGAVIDRFPGGPGDPVVNIGAINGAASVDYAFNKVYFASQEGVTNDSVWCLDLGPPSDALRYRWSRPEPGNINGSALLSKGRVYVVDDASNIWSIEASDALDQYFFPLGGGDGKGFVFPDRRNTDVYVATQPKVAPAVPAQVHGLVDNGLPLGLTRKWPAVNIPSPSTASVVLYRPGTDELYVGVDDLPGADQAGLLRINVSTGLPAGQLELEAAVQAIGPPSLDIVYGLIHVGSEGGIYYAVDLTF